MAYDLRDEIMKKLGSPGSALRPEGNAVWVVFGIVAALTFTLLGWWGGGGVGGWVGLRHKSRDCSCVG